MARGYKDRGMAAYSELQQAEFAAEKDGYTAVRHQREVGTGYFDMVTMAVSGGKASTTALSKSTEAAQFNKTPIPTPADLPNVDQNSIKAPKKLVALEEPTIDEPQRVAQKA